MTHYAVLIGDVGQGKSTLVEKMTGVKGKSSNEDFSSTKESTLYYTPCRTLLICDTPGTNPIRERLDHNMWIAHALNTHPVSLVLIVVKADTGRIDTVIDAVRKYTESFSSLIDNLGVCVTHMDKVTWTSDTFKHSLENEFGIERAIFSDIKKGGKQLIQDISNVCEEAKTLCITSDNFLKYFKISNNNIKILHSINREVGNFKVMTNDFDMKMPDFSENEQIDLIFEFQAWMAEQILHSQQKVASENNFTFIDNIANEAGHIANMTNQLKLVLYDVRIRAQRFQNNHGLCDIRKCPHCGEIWAKLEGCDGETTCGERMTSTFDARYTQLANFSFHWFQERLVIKKRRERQIEERWGRDGKGEGVGCGKRIVWKNMTPVRLPDDLASIAAVSVEDIKDLPEPVKEIWGDFFARKMGEMSLRGKTSNSRSKQHRK